MAKSKKKGKPRDDEAAAKGRDRGQEQGTGPEQSKGAEKISGSEGRLSKIQATAQAAAQTAALKQAQKQVPKQATKPRPKSAEERKKEQIDGIKKTVYPSALGIVAGFACFYAPATINLLPWHFVLIVVLAATYFIQKVTYPLLKIDATEFKGKDWFYVEFMAIDLWLVTWTLLLN